jgi:hypothetical protein
MLVRKPEGKKQSGRCRQRWDAIKMYLKETALEDVDKI